MADPTEIDAVTAQVLQETAVLSHRLSGMAVDTEGAWFPNVLVGILNCSLVDYTTVQDGVRRSIYPAAWGKRNLMELRLITNHVLATKQNALDFKDQFAHDAAMFYDALDKLHVIVYGQLSAHLAEEAKKPGPMQPAWEAAHERHVDSGPQNQEIHEEAEAFKHAASELGIGSKHFKRTDELAVNQGRSDEWEAVKTICSKLLHRTPLSIASAIEAVSLAEIRPMLINSALSDVLLIFDAIKRHVESHGIQPPS
jgi:hypothetical protein